MFVKQIAILALIFSFSFGLLALSSTDAFAARGGKKAVPAPSTSSSFALVLLNSTDGLAHWGQNTTFAITTTATAYPYVSLTCVQLTKLVLSGSAGFWASYPWPQERIMSLSSMVWTSGAADCTATLRDFYSGTVLGTLGFHVYR